MSNQIVISSGAKVRELEGVLTGTSGIVNALPINGSLGIPQLDVNGKILVSQLPNSVMEYQGTWNANTNTPTLTNGGAFNQGDVYLCNVAGTTDFGAGPISFVVSDQVIYSGSIWQKASGTSGTVTSVAASITGNAIGLTGSPITTAGTLAFAFAGTNLQYVNGAGNLTTFPTLITSIGLSMPSAFSVANSPLTANGTIAVTGAGYASQYIRGDGTLADFPSSGGGGSSVSYYLNGGTSQGTILGTTYYEMSKIADTGTGVDFTKSGDGFIVAFLTDANDPAQLNIPAGNWNYEIYASMSANGGTPEMYAELYVYNGTAFTLIATSTHEILYDGTNLNLYTFAMTVPATTLALTDRLAVKLYATNSGGKTTTVHTQDSHLCQIITTFSTGITALNGLTAQVQYFQTGTSGTDFNISSITATHTFNLPTASASNRGALSSSDWSVFNGKQAALNGTGFVKISGTTISYDNTAYLPMILSATAKTVDINGQQFNIYGTASSYTSGRIVVDPLFAGVGYQISGIFDGLQISTDGSALFSNSGITRFMNQVRFDSTLTNGTYTYNLPSASGTIALVGGSGVGTVTSVAMTVPTGLSISGSPITTSGTLALTFSAGYSIPTTSSQTNWDTAYTNRITSLTTTGSSGSATLVTNTLNIPTYTLTGLGGQPLATNLTSLSGLTYVSTSFVKMTAAGTFSLDTTAYGTGTVTSVGLSSATSGVTIGSTPITTSGTITIAIATATTSQNGLLSSTDWTTFNSKQSALTNPVTGTGTTNYLPKFTGASTIGNSIIQESSGNIGINQSPASIFTLDIKSTTGTLGFQIRETSGNNGVYIYPNSSGYNKISSNYNTTAPYLPLSLTARESNLDLVLWTDGNVSIGQSSNASYKLDVNGTGRFSGILKVDLTGSDHNLQVNSSGQYSTIELQHAGVIKAYPMYWDNTNNAAYVGTTTAGAQMILQSGANVAALTLASTGAATFSSSVTAAYYTTSGTGTVFDAAGAGTSSIRAAFTNTGGTFYIGRDNSTGSSFGATYAAILYESGANPMVFWTNATERMRITSGGNVGIGTTTDYGYKTNIVHSGDGLYIRGGSTISNNALVIANSSGTTKVSIDATGAATFSSTILGYTNIGVTNSGAQASILASTATYADGYDAILSLNNTHTGGRNWSLRSTNNSRGTFGGGKLVFQDTTAGTDTAIMTLVTGGNVLIGNSGTDRGTALLQVSRSGTIQELNQLSTSANTTFLLFSTTTSTGMGSISRNGTANSVLYNTSSDYRLKHDLKDFNGLDLVNKIKAYDFAWNIDNSRNHGFIAHELQEVLSYAVHGKKDDEMMQGVDYSKLTPILIKAVQELKLEKDTEIAELRKQIEELKQIVATINN